MWNDLTLSDKARMIQLAVKSGITDLNTIQRVYNTFANGGNLDGDETIKKVNSSRADFVKRLKDPNREYIDNGDGTISTHRMAYADDGRGNAVVYPEIQTVKRDKQGRYWYRGKLEQFNGRRAYENAMRTGDYVPMSTEDAEWFTQNYKDYYPEFDKYANGGYLYETGGKKDPPKYPLVLSNAPQQEPPYSIFTSNNIQEAIERTPKVVTPPKVMPKQVGSDYVLKDVAARVFATENNKDNPKGGYNKKTGRWLPVDSVEGGAPTIAYGIKFGTGSPEAKLAERQGYLTDEQANNAVYSLSQFHINKAKEVYDNKFGEGSWDKLGPKSQSILADYSFNVGLQKFPKLMEGFHSGNIDTIRREYKRYTNGEPLTGRNNYILKDIDSLGTFYPIIIK